MRRRCTSLPGATANPVSLPQVAHQRDVRIISGGRCGDTYSPGCPGCLQGPLGLALAKSAMY